MANWWDKMIGGTVNREQDWAGQRYGVTGAGDRRATTEQRAAALTGAKAAPVSPVNMQTLIPSNLETAGRMGGAYGGGMLGLSAPQMPQQGYMGMSDEELLAWILGGSGGGGGVDLSGYQGLIDDVNARRDQTNIRKWQQRKFLTDLFGAAEGRLTADQEALAGIMQGQLDADAARRATEIGLIRGADAERLATANAAREALGTEGGADLSTDLSENLVAQTGAGGSVAERDARINEAIQRQQIQSQIAGLIPMEQMAVSSLMSSAEDRIAALASERAAIKAQMAQARASARGGGGPSVNEKLAALGFINQLNAPGEAPSFGGAIGAAREIQQYFGPEASNVLGIANRLLTGADISRFTPTTMAGASELLTRLAAADPEVQMFLNRTPEAAGAIIKYIVESSE